MACHIFFFEWGPFHGKKVTEIQLTPYTLDSFGIKGIIVCPYPPVTVSFCSIFVQLKNERQQRQPLISAIPVISSNYKRKSAWL